MYRDFNQREIHSVLSNSMLNFNPHICDKQGQSIQVIIAIFIKYVAADRLFLWNLLWSLCKREGKSFSSPKTPFGYFQGDHAVPFFFFQNEF